MQALLLFLQGKDFSYRLFFFPQVIDYNGGRTLEDLVDFLKSGCDPSKAGSGPDQVSVMYLFYHAESCIEFKLLMWLFVLKPVRSASKILTLVFTMIELFRCLRFFLPSNCDNIDVSGVTISSLCCNGFSFNKL